MLSCKGSQLVDYIRAHGHKAMHSLLDNIIYAKSVGSDWEAIEPTTYTVRNWLGY